MMDLTLKTYNYTKPKAKRIRAQSSNCQSNVVPETYHIATNPRVRQSTSLQLCDDHQKSRKTRRQNVWSFHLYNYDELTPRLISCQAETDVRFLPLVAPRTQNTALSRIHNPGPYQIPQDTLPVVNLYKDENRVSPRKWWRFLSNISRPCASTGGYLGEQSVSRHSQRQVFKLHQPSHDVNQLV